MKQPPAGVLRGQKKAGLTSQTQLVSGCAGSIPAGRSKGCPFSLLGRGCK